MTAVIMYLFVGAVCGYAWGRLTAPSREDVYDAAEQIYETGYDAGKNDRTLHDVYYETQWWNK